jgi:hypothetical protein
LVVCLCTKSRLSLDIPMLLGEHARQSCCEAQPILKAALCMLLSKADRELVRTRKVYSDKTMILWLVIGRLSLHRT